MGAFGHIIICVAAVASAGGGALMLTARGSEQRFEAGRRLLFGAALAAAVALLVLVFALVTHDYRIAYVRSYADRSMGLGFLITALWGGQQGSLLFWAALQTFFTAGVLLWPGSHSRRLLPTAVAILAVLQAFFLLLVLFHSNPFAELGTDANRGVGINPLLRNFYMVFHPPTLFLGYVGFAVPAAFVLASLTEKSIGEKWILDLRPWVLIAWGFLTIGNVLGMVWAYEELGWGGYWGWDPVENASFMPWLTGTALLHTLHVREKRGGFRIWTVVTAMLTFLLVIFGTFLTRSGVIESVHAFAGATTGPYFLGMIIALLALTVLFTVLRRGELVVEDDDDESDDAPVVTRDTIFTLTNWAFIAATAFVWIGTMMPLLTTVLQGEKVAVTPEFFNKWMAPLGLVILLLIGVCTVIGWQVRSLKRLGRRAAWPLALGVIVASVAAVSGGIPSSTTGWMRFLPIIAFGLLGTVGWTVFAQLRQVLATAGALDAPERRRRLGGQVVHLSVVLLFVGFTGSAFTVDRSISLGRGDAMVAGDFTIKLLGMREDSDIERYALMADLEVRRGGRSLGIYSPSRHQYHSHPGQPTSEVAIRTTLGEDLFLVLGEVDGRTGRAVVRAVVNPLVLWIWLGGLLMTLGTLLALLPAGWSYGIARPKWEERGSVIRFGMTVLALAVSIGVYWGAGLAMSLAALTGLLLIYAVVLVGMSLNILVAPGGDL